MNRRERANEQRKSFRCRVPEQRKEAEIKVGRRWVALKLFNESAGGFAAWTEQDPGVQVNDLVQLKSELGCFEVRVAHVGPVKASEKPGEEAGPSFRLGLERVRDLNRDLQPEAGASKDHRRRNLGRSGGVFVAAATVLVVGVVMGAVGAAWRPVPGGWRSWRQQSHAPTARSQSVGLAEVVRELGLTQQQQHQILGCAEMTAQAIQELDVRWIHDTPEVRARKQVMLLEVAWQQILALLTEEQRQRWKELFP